MHRKETHSKTLILLLLVVIIIVVAIVVAITKKNNDSKNYNSNEQTNSLIGTYIYYVDGTKYEFKEDGSGSMSSKDFNFEYKYTTQENNLNIDFLADEVHDVKYTYSINGNILKLVSVEGTVSVGEEYKLEKENK